MLEEERGATLPSIKDINRDSRKLETLLSEV